MPRSARLVAATVLTLATVAQAAESAPVAPPAAPTLSGWVDVMFGWNTNRPADRENFSTGIGTTGARADEFTVNQAAVELQRAPAPVGYHLVFGFGTGFDLLHSGERPGNGIGHEVWRHLLTASVSYLVPVGRGLTVEAGVYPSHIGFESFPSQANWNYTRSWTGEFSPYYQAGVKASYAFTDQWSAQLHLINGWQNIGENNEGKAIGTQVAWTGERGSAALNTFAGPELPNDGAHWRLFVDLVAQLKATDALQLGVTADLGRQSLPGGTVPSWFGVAAFVRYAFSPQVALAGRGDVYRDVDGVITGIGETLSEGTLTCELRPTERLILKLEGRYDHSTAAVFHLHDTDPSGAPLLGHDQLLAIAGAVATF